MPFDHVNSNFQPHELCILNVAFNDAWQQLAAVNGGTTEFQQQLLRKKLAQHIIATASTGQFDPRMLTGFALRALLKKPAFAPLEQVTPTNEGGLALQDTPL